ncbi:MULTISPECIES: hypothetical protein [Kitasatospora]|uniref:hypothetical protein n=1 Tax=Kitasatospora TaxID=2063 RepID=UPI0005271CBF|nr:MULTISPECIES: hypothetical protein [Kitasatospora]
MSFDDQDDSRERTTATTTAATTTAASGWRRIALPVPPLGKLARGSGIADRLGTCTGSGLAGWVATGHTHGEATWATVVLAVAMIAAEAVRARRCACPAPRGLS